MFLRLLFLVIASLGVLAALGTVMARNLVRAALYLVAFFFLVACLFVLLEAEFLAAIQVLVYIGAVAILILFGIMLTRNIQGDETTRGTSSSVPDLRRGRARGAGDSDRWNSQRHGPGPPAGLDGGRQPSTVRYAVRAIPTRRAWPVNDMARSIGHEMMTRFVIPFELAGLLLTASVVGAIALAMVSRDEPDSPETVATPGSRGRSGDDPSEPPSPRQAPEAEALASSGGRGAPPHDQSDIPLSWFLYFAAIVFCIGLFGVLVRTQHDRRAHGHRDHAQCRQHQLHRLLALPAGRPGRWADHRRDVRPVRRSRSPRPRSPWESA